jgi:hypothetical protein
MDSIVIADNAAQTRAAARAVIIHMRSNFHKRGAIGTLRRELARQKMPDTAVRDCFLTAIMDKVKKYIRFAMKLKTAGTIDKFQIVNRKGQPILQTGKRNGNYADYDGDVEDHDQVERRRRRRKDRGPRSEKKARKQVPLWPPHNSTQMEHSQQQELRWTSPPDGHSKRRRTFQNSEL